MMPGKYAASNLLDPTDSCLQHIIVHMIACAHLQPAKCWPVHLQFSVCEGLRLT